MFYFCIQVCVVIWFIIRTISLVRFSLSCYLLIVRIIIYLCTMLDIIHKAKCCLLQYYLFVICITILLHTHIILRTLLTHLIYDTGSLSFYVVLVMVKWFYYIQWVIIRKNLHNEELIIREKSWIIFMSSMPITEKY